MRLDVSYKRTNSLGMGDMSSVHQDLGVECGAEATMMSLSAFKVLIMCGKRQIRFGGLSLFRRASSLIASEL